MPASSPKSYSNFPLVSLGHEHGSAAMKRVFLPSWMLCRMNGREMPQKFEPPPKQPITMSGYSPVRAICFSASRPMTVWCRQTWLSTDPRAYLQFGVLTASSMASEMAQPREPWSLGLRVMMSLPARVDIEGDGVTVAPNACMMLRRKGFCS